MVDNILLIYPPIDVDYHTMGVNDSPPLGLVALHNYVQRKLGQAIRITILDGEHNSLENIADSISQGDFDLVGIQPMMASYKNALRLAEVAKSYGATTVFGGHHATQLASQIARNRRQTVDYVVAGDGEEAFAALISSAVPRSIPNLVFWDTEAKDVVRTQTRNVPIDEGRITGFTTELLAQYKDDSSLERGQAVSLRAYSHKGCSNRTNSQYCYFCGRADRGLRFKTPKVYMDELRYLAVGQGAEYIFEIGDDFLQDASWLEEIARFKATEYKDIQSHLKIFARANRITPDVVRLLKQLDVDEVAIGFESGSERILRNINKRASPQQNLDAAELLFSSGIDTIASFVLGLPGEDGISLQATYEHAQKVAEMAHNHLGRPPQEVIANLIEINPGSPAFRQMVATYPKKYVNEDILGIRDTQNDYFRMAFGIDNPKALQELRTEFAEWAKKINMLGKYTYPAGWEKKDMV